MVFIGAVGGDEVFAVGVGVGGGVVEVLGTEGVAFLDDQTVVVSSVGFVWAVDDGSGSDVTAYEVGSVATRRAGQLNYSSFVLVKNVDCVLTVCKTSFKSFKLTESLGLLAQ